MRVLVTGHDGYLGSVLAPRLQRADFEVTGVDNYSTGQGSASVFNADFQQIAADFRDLREHTLKGYDAIVHLAAVDGQAATGIDPKLSDSINRIGTLKLASRARAAGIRRFVFASSYKVYDGSTPQRCHDEESDPNPASSFGASKAAAESGLLSLADRRFEPLILRIGSVFGPSPNLRLDTFINNLVAWAATKGRVLLGSTGTAFRPTVHVEDVAETIATILSHPSRGESILNVCDGNSHRRVREVAEVVQEVVPHSMVEFSANARPDPLSYRVSNARLRRVYPNLRKFRSLSDGVLELHRTLRLLEVDSTDIGAPQRNRAAGLAAQLAVASTPSPTVEARATLATSSGIS